ncbi:hypothetical protein ACVKXF_002927 [Curtobacterium sp. PvP017]|jgi:hypothetical protein
MSAPADSALSFPSAAPRASGAIPQFERGDAPVLHLVVEDGEGGLVELDDVDGRSFELPRLLDHSPLRWSSSASPAVQEETASRL